MNRVGESIYVAPAYCEAGLKVTYRDSGGLSSINFGCPLPDDPLY